MAAPLLAILALGARQVVSWLFKKYIKKQLKKKIGKTAIKEVRKLLLRELKQLLSQSKGKTADLLQNTIKWVEKASDEELIGLLDPVGEVIDIGLKKVGDNFVELCKSPRLGEDIKLEGNPQFGSRYESPYTPQTLHESAQIEQKGIPFGTVIRGRNYNPNPLNPF